MNALGNALLQFLWQGALIALLLGVVLYLGRPASARVRYALACVALFAMPLVFGVTFWVSLAPAHAAVAVAPSAGINLAWREFSGSADFSPRSRAGVPWPVMLWAAGVLCLYSYKLAGWIAVQRLRRVGVCDAPAIWQQRVAELAVRMRVSRPVVLLESCLADAPVMIGHFRPMILAPLGILAGLPTEQVESILLHELAHISRYDYPINLMQSFIEGLLFYHPATWWISSVIRTEREFCCDDAVLAMGGDARCYAEALHALEHHRRTVGEPALPASGGNLMRRIRRLLRESERPRSVMGPVLGLTLLSGCIALAAWYPNAQPVRQQIAHPLAPTPVTVEAPVVLMAQAKAPEAPTPPAPPAPAPAPAPAAPAPAAQVPSPVESQDENSRENRLKKMREVQLKRSLETPYKKWLDEEVVWIISDEERQAFTRLQTNDEREKFIEQFWLRRDPTPGTPENEMQEEHYRRIVGSNQRFGTSARPGWETDRGRIYIMYGPPDEIDSHTLGGADSVPYEIWHYRYIQGIGNDVLLEFRDQNRTGDYPLTVDPARGVTRIAQASKDAERFQDSVRRAVVDVSVDRQVTVSVPLEAGADTINLQMRVEGPGRKQAIPPIEDVISWSGPFPPQSPVKFSKVFSLAAGSYRLMIAAKDIGTGAIATFTRTLRID